MIRGKYRLFAILLACVCLVGCGDKVISADEAKQALRKLPYRFEFRSVPIPGDSEGAVAGTAYGPRGIFLRFGLALGPSASPIPVPQAGTREIIGFRDRWMFTSDLQVVNSKGKLIVPPRFKTLKQWREAGHMEVEITNAICEADIGEPCPI
jgi:hypothetical protein